MSKPVSYTHLDVYKRQELPAGHYRLIKQFAFFESERDWDYDTYNLSCEFTIR